MLYDYEYSLLIQDNHSIGKLKQQLIKNHMILVKSFPIDDQLLENFISLIGKLHHEERNNNERAVFDLKVSKLFGQFQSHAQSPHEFSLHTDCSHFEDVPSGICLLCVKPDILGGKSLFCSIDKVAAELSDNTLKNLLTKRWMMANQTRSVLSLSPIGYSIIYNRSIIVQCNTIKPEDIHDFDMLDKISFSLSERLHLETGELLLMNNHRSLHGRTSFDINSGRFFKRVRFYL